MAIAERILQLHRDGDPRSDETLVRAAQAGGSEAASTLIERYYRRVSSFISYLTHGKANTEDLTQEVFARALGALDRFNGSYRFEPWLLRIARNLVIDEARRRPHLPEPTDPSDLPQLEAGPSSNDDVWESISQQLSTSMVNRALRRLPLRQRTALVLREIQGMAYADIAQAIGTNGRGVEATLRRARARFRLELADIESAEAEQAVCRRTVGLTQGGNATSGEAARHLRRCPECRGRAGSAERLFGIFPPLVLGGLPWRPRVVRAAQRGRELLRAPSQVTNGSSSLAQLVEVAATVVVAAIVSATGPRAVPVTKAHVSTTPVSIEQALPDAQPASPGPEVAALQKPDGVSSARNRPKASGSRQRPPAENRPTPSALQVDLNMSEGLVSDVTSRVDSQIAVVQEMPSESATAASAAVGDAAGAAESAVGSPAGPTIGKVADTSLEAVEMAGDAEQTSGALLSGAAGGAHDSGASQVPPLAGP